MKFKFNQIKCHLCLKTLKKDKLNGTKYYTLKCINCPFITGAPVIEMIISLCKLISISSVLEYKNKKYFCIIDSNCIRIYDLDFNFIIANKIFNISNIDLNTYFLSMQNSMNRILKLGSYL